MKKHIKGIVILLCMIMVSCITVSAGVIKSSKATDADYRKYNLRERSVENLKINKVDNKKYAKKSGEALPEKYDPRNEEWFKKASTMKDQQETGLCWAFSTTTAAELSYYLEYGSVLETSPAHLGYFMYNWKNDPLRNTTGDANVAQDGNWREVGGDLIYTQQAMANWTGLALEALCPFANRYKGYSQYSFNNYITQQNSYLINAKDKNAVKEAIKKYGSVVAAYNADRSYDAEKETDEGFTVNHYCYEEDAWTNHEVAVIGWDDNYNRKNFKYSDGDFIWFKPLDAIASAGAIPNLSIGTPLQQHLDEDTMVSVVKICSI